MALTRCGKCAKYSLVLLAVYGILTGTFGIISSMYQATSSSSSSLHNQTKTPNQRPTPISKWTPRDKNQTPKKPMPSGQTPKVAPKNNLPKDSESKNENQMEPDEFLTLHPSPKEVIYTSAMTVFLSSLAIIGSLLEQVIVLITFCLLMILSLLMRLLNVSTIYKEYQMSPPDTSILIVVFIIFSIFECSLIILSIKLALDIRYSKMRRYHDGDQDEESRRHLSGRERRNRSGRERRHLSGRERCQENDEEERPTIQDTGFIERESILITTVAELVNDESQSVVFVDGGSIKSGRESIKSGRESIKSGRESIKSGRCEDNYSHQINDAKKRSVPESSVQESGVQESGVPESSVQESSVQESSVQKSNDDSGEKNQSPSESNKSRFLDRKRSETLTCDQSDETPTHETLNNETPTHETPTYGQTLRDQNENEERLETRVSIEMCDLKYST